MLQKEELVHVIESLTRSCEVLRHRGAKCTAAELRLQTLVRMALREARFQLAERESHDDYSEMSKMGMVGIDPIA